LDSESNQSKFVSIQWTEDCNYKSNEHSAIKRQDSNKADKSPYKLFLSKDKITAYRYRRKQNWKQKYLKSKNRGSNYRALRPMVTNCDIVEELLHSRPKKTLTKIQKNKKHQKLLTNTDAIGKQAAKIWQTTSISVVKTRKHIQIRKLKTKPSERTSRPQKIDMREET
jgi:hypothetical protein